MTYFSCCFQQLVTPFADHTTTEAYPPHALNHIPAWPQDQPSLTRALLARSSISFADSLFVQPIPGYIPYTPDPLVLRYIGEVLAVHPEVFQEHLCSTTHLDETEGQALGMSL